MHFFFFRITSKRFAQVADEIYELFPTTTKTDWYKPASSNAYGDAVSASGCLIHFYKLYRKDLALAAISKKSSTTSDLLNTSTNSGTIE